MNGSLETRISREVNRGRFFLAVAGVSGALALGAAVGEANASADAAAAIADCGEASVGSKFTESGDGSYEACINSVDGIHNAVDAFDGIGVTAAVGLIAGVVGALYFGYVDSHLTEDHYRFDVTAADGPPPSDENPEPSAPAPEAEGPDDYNYGTELLG